MKLIYSIIVPVYNTEKYLKKCLDSLIEQTYKDIEILVIDDGSTDFSQRIYKEYNDTRIKCFYKENSGLADTRNYGIKKAIGDYIIFLDSDDYFNIDGIEQLNRVITNSNDIPDVISVNLKQVWDNEKKCIELSHTNQSNQITTGLNFLKNEMEKHTMSMAAVLKIYKRSFLLKNQLFFKSGILHEDEQFTPRAILKTNKLLPTNLNFYNYLIRENSITTKNATLKNFTDLYNTLKELQTLYQKIEDEDFKKLSMNNLLEKYLYMYAKANICKKEYKAFQHKDFVYNKAIGKKNKMKVFLFLLNDYLYCFLQKNLSI